MSIVGLMELVYIVGTKVGALFYIDAYNFDYDNAINFYLGCYIGK